MLAILNGVPAGSSTMVMDVARAAPKATLPSPMKGCPKPSTVSPHTDVVVPTAAMVTSPLAMTPARLPPGTGGDASVEDDAAGAEPDIIRMLPNSRRRALVSRFRSLPGAAVTTMGRASRWSDGTLAVDTPAARATVERIDVDSRTDWRSAVVAAAGAE